MKENIEFYQHYANADQHPKFKMLRVKYGWEGEGKFWALNNRIAQAKRCLLDTTKKFNIAALADDLDMNIDEFQKYLTYLIEECELIIKKEGLITTNILQENLFQVMGNREKARDRKQKKGSKKLGKHSDETKKLLKSSGEPLKSSGEPLKSFDEKITKENKIKETKIKETKIKQTKLNNNSSSKNDEEESFEKFWLIYNKPIEKKKCLAKWKNFSLEIKEIIFKTLPDYVESTPDRQFRKNPSTYLNNECWNDEIIETGGNNGKAKHNYSGIDNREPVIPDRFPSFPTN